MILNIVTPTSTMVEDLEIREVTVPAYSGELTILPGHAPLVTQIGTGVLTYKGKESETRVAISWGYCEVSPKGVRILAETAEIKEDVDTERARQAIKLAEEKLAGDLDPAGIDKYQRKLKRARTRLDL